MTSIEWLFEQIEGEGDIQRDVLSNVLEIKISVSNFLEIKREAKEMHKQEIINAYEKGEFNDGMNESSEQYYQETFVSKGSGMSEKPNNHIEPQLPQQEISDEEIQKAAKEYDIKSTRWGAKTIFIDAIKWYREQLKPKQPKKD